MGITVDFEAEGLLDGVQGAEREARLALLSQLAADGADLDDLRRAVSEDRLALIPVERVLGGAGGVGRYTAEEAAALGGLDVEFFLANRQALGLPRPDPGQRAFDDGDVAAAGYLRRFRDAGLPDRESLEVVRVLGMGMARYAEAVGGLFAQTFLQPGDDEREVAERFAQAAGRLLPVSGPWLQYAFAVHLRTVARDVVIGAEERSAGRLPATVDTAVAFADLVGFTELGETVPIEELGGLAGRLAHLTAAVVAPPVRLVKTIGDAVMLVSPQASAMVAAALAMVDAGAAEPDFPPLRVGVSFGPAVLQWGDWYGATVNLADRVTARARPGSVLVTAPVRDQVQDAFRLSFAGERRLKGIAAPVPLWRARPLDAVQR